MKQIFPAAILSIIIHFAFLKLDTEWISKNNITVPTPRSVTVTMSYRQPEKKEVTPKQVEKKIKKKKHPPQKNKPEPKIIPKKREVPREEPKEPEVEENEEPVEEVKENIPEEEPESSSHGNNVSSMQVTHEAIPNYRSNPPPRYPQAARRREYQGTVMLEVLVTEKGRVSNLWVFESSGYRLLDNAAVNAVKKWAFEPGMKNGIPIEMWVKVPVRFELESAD